MMRPTVSRLSVVSLAVVGLGLLMASAYGARTGLADGLTREQLAGLYPSLAGAQFQPPACVAGQEMFTDVPASSPFCPWIEELARRGITAGCTATLYCPNAPVTRSQMAAFVVRAIDTAIASVPEGPPGPAGPPGPQGPPGVSQAFSRWGETDQVPGDTLPPPDDIRDLPLVNQLEVPAGSYVVNVAAMFGGVGSDPVPPEGHHVYCVLISEPADTPSGWIVIDTAALNLLETPTGATPYASMPLTGTTTLDEPGTISMHCGSRAALTVWQPKLVATQVNSVS